MFVIEMALWVIKAIQDIIAAIMALLGIPPFMDIIIAIIQPILEGVISLLESILAVLMQIFEFIWDLIEDIAAIIEHLIKFIIEFIAGLLGLIDFGALAILLAPVIGVIMIIGAIIATFTPTQELTIPIPILDGLMGG
jgi:phage-related protein